MATKNTEIATVEEQPANYLALSTNPTELQEVMAENLGGQRLTALDFTVITVPSGTSAPNFAVPNTETGEVEGVKTLTGVIIHHQFNRVMWVTPKDQSQDITPPDCVSAGAEVGSKSAGWLYDHAVALNLQAQKPGIPEAAQACDFCPFSQFGTAKGGTGKGQWCNLQRHIYIAVSGAILPWIIRIPPKSLAAARNYFAALTKAGIPASGVVTEFGLKSGMAGSNKYYEVTFRRAALLDQPARANMKAYAASIKPFLISSAASVITEPASVYAE